MGQKRDYKYELIRIIAIIFVIGTHSLSLVPTTGSTARELTYRIISSLIFTAVPLFFFMSGKFALQKPISDDNQYFPYYLKKTVSIIFPTIVYMIIYSAYLQHETTGSLNELKSRIIPDILGTHSGLHFWYIYVLIGNLFIAPFMAKVFTDISKKGALIFMGIGLLHNTLLAYSPYLFNSSYNWVYPFAMWSIYFYIGICVEKFITGEKEKKIFILIGLISFIIIILKKTFFSYQAYIHDSMPSFTLFSMAVYITLKSMNIQFSEKAQKVIIFLGKQTFSIFLIHFLCLWLFVKFFPNTGLQADLYWIICIISVFIISFVLSYILDLILFKPIQKLSNKLISKKE